MLIDIINHDAEKALIALLEQANRQGGTWGALYFERSKLKLAPNEEDFLLTVKPALENKPAALYFLGDGDVVITWKGAQKTTLEELCHRLYERYASAASNKLHAYFDLQAQGEELRLVCKRKAPRAPMINTPPAVATPPPAAPAPPLKFPDEMATRFGATVYERKQRAQPDILVVEDQAFSSKLLTSMLNQHYKTHTAATAARAMELYCTHVPDIVFLDIELPDLDGHRLAAMIHELDPRAYIVMVTGNHSAQDVLRAKENSVKGFIAKPYNRLKIQSSIDKFIQERA